MHLTKKDGRDRPSIFIFLEIPPMFLFVFFLMIAVSFAHKLGIRFMVMYNVINLPPVWQAAYIAVVYKVVGFQFAAPVVVLAFFFLWIVTVHSPKINTSLVAPVYCVL